METELERAKSKQCHNDKENISKFRIEMVKNRTQQNVKTLKGNWNQECIRILGNAWECNLGYNNTLQYCNLSISMNSSSYLAVLDKWRASLYMKVVYYSLTLQVRYQNKNTCCEEVISAVVQQYTSQYYNLSGSTNFSSNLLKIGKQKASVYSKVIYQFPALLSSYQMRNQHCGVIIHTYRNFPQKMLPQD